MRLTFLLTFCCCNTNTYTIAVYINYNIQRRDCARDLGLEFINMWDRDNSPEWEDYLAEVALVYQRYHRRHLENRVYTAALQQLA